MTIHQKKEKVVTNWSQNIFFFSIRAKHVLNVGKITLILETAQQNARNAINVKREVILKNAADQK